MTERDNWFIQIEGLGPTHNGETKDANAALVRALHDLETSGHKILQARFTSSRGEENLCEPIYRDLHEELVAMGARADALRVERSAQVGTHSERDEISRWEGEGGGVGPSIERDEPSGKEVKGEEEKPKAAHEGRAKVR